MMYFILDEGDDIANNNILFLQDSSYSSHSTDRTKSIVTPPQIQALQTGEVSSKPPGSSHKIRLIKDFIESELNVHMIENQSIL